MNLKKQILSFFYQIRIIQLKCRLVEVEANLRYAKRPDFLQVLRGNELRLHLNFIEELDNRVASLRMKLHSFEQKTKSIK